MFQGMGVSEMASMLTQHPINNECNESEPIMQPHPDQTDTIDGELVLLFYKNDHEHNFLL